MGDRPFYRGRPALGTRTLVAQTCLSCGVILGARHFRKQAGSWTAHCHSCFSKRSRAKHGEAIAVHHNATTHVFQADSLETASRRGSIWTMSELDRTVEAMGAGMSYQEIALLLGRTHYAIGPAVSRFGLKQGWPTREEWRIQLHP